MVLLLETKPQGDNAEVCYQPLKPRHGRGVCVSECVSCFISAQRCKGAWPYHSVSASSPPALEIVNTNTHTHTHTHTHERIRSEEMLRNSSIHPSVALFESAGFLSVCGDLDRQLISMNCWMPMWLSHHWPVLSRGAVTCTGSPVSQGLGIGQYHVCCWKSQPGYLRSYTHLVVSSFM